jgi:hypothetical protein
MTHDKLLAKWDNTPIDIGSATTVWKTLRAVVELHKPLAEAKNSPFKDACLGCSKPYPCPTIQAIEKELM